MDFSAKVQKPISLKSCACRCEAAGSCHCEIHDVDFAQVFVVGVEKRWTVWRNILGDQCRAAWGT